MFNLRNWIFTILTAAVFVLIFFLGSITNFYTDWLWFNEVRYGEVFWTIFWTKVLLSLSFTAIFFIIIYVNITLANFLSKRGIIQLEEKFFEILDQAGARIKINKILVIGLIVLSAMAAAGAGAMWESYLKFKNPINFEQLDPLFKLDIGFYVFQLPFIKFAYSFLMFAFILAAAAAAAIYLFKGSLRIFSRGALFSKPAEAHLSILGAILAAFFAFGYKLSMYDLLFNKRELLVGANYMDSNVILPVLNILFYLGIILALAFIYNAFRRGWRAPVVAAAALIAVSVIGRGIYPEIMQRLIIAPNELSRELPYIEQHIKSTHAAYGLNKIEVREFPAEENLTLKDIKNNDATISNIRLWDHRPLRDTYSQIQEIRTYYNFVDVDIDRYTINGEYHQIMLSPRELSYSKLPSQVWINEHLTYTHGYGVVASPVTKLTPEGLPHLWVKDIPPVSDKLSIDRPEIYYGEIANDYCLVKTKSKEFDYPVGDANKYTEYGGSGGVPIGSLWQRLIFALKFSNTKILLSSDIRADSRILYNRRILERLNKITPFIRYDQDPYIVVASGKLFWIADGYTITDMFPASREFSRYGNYIRNSVKVIIDAYNGSMNFYVSDLHDPIIKCYRKIFPDLFYPIFEMPEDLKAHIRYPEALFNIQAHLYQTYHMQDPQVFYNKEDLWDTAKEVYEDSSQKVEAYYVIMKLPGEEKEEFILMLPFTPRDKDNMSAWMGVRCDGVHYGDIIVYKFPKKKMVFGPMQIEARIDQESEISKELSLWSQRGSDVIRGNLLVIPIEKSLLYVEPLYLKAEKSQIPELKRVIAAYGNRIVMGDTLESALSGLFGGKTSYKMPQPESNQGEFLSIKDMSKQALDIFNKAKSYLQQGNFGAFGEMQERLGDVLRKLNK